MGQFKSLSVIGAGSWGIALCKAFSNSFETVKLYSKNQNIATELLQGYSSKLNINFEKIDNIEISCNLDFVLKDSDLIIWAVPVQKSLDLLLNHLNSFDSKTKYIIIASKGLEMRYNQSLYAIFKDKIKLSKLGVLSGPNFANEVLMGLPCGASLGFENIENAKIIANTLKTPTFRIYANNSPYSMSLYSALKNIMAIASGILMAKQLGENAKCMLITRASVEINRFINIFNNSLNIMEKDISHTLSGIGDLILTCNSLNSRNSSFGYNFALNNLEIEHGGKTIEGFFSAKVAYEIANKFSIHAPIIKTIYKIIYEKLSIIDGLDELLNSQSDFE